MTFVAPTVCTWLLTPLCPPTPIMRDCYDSPIDQILPVTGLYTGNIRPSSLPNHQYTCFML